MLKHSNSSYIKIIDRVTLGQNKHLLIVEIGNKKLLIGVADNNISTLYDLEDLTLEEFSTSLDNNKTFANVLSEAILNSKFASKLKKGNNKDENNK